MKKREYFPALRGRLGDWAFYSILMTLEQVANNISYAKEIHNSTKLSEMIQRELDEKKRAGEIGNYLLQNTDRFFNSLVVAVYDGDPEWHEFQNLRSVTDDIKIEDLSYNSRYSVGYLSLSGQEKLFALDGQHRLAGIRNALKAAVDLNSEEVSVIVVAHHTDAKGLERTRKLFTTLNKTAKPVSKSEIIALDEADAMAITARSLVEYDPRFGDIRVDILRKQANLPKGNTTHLITLINLYDLLEILFAKTRKGARSSDLKRIRPSDQELKGYLQLAQEYFTLLGKVFPNLQACFVAKKPETVIKKHRHARGGNVLFRPIGLLIFTEIVAALMRTTDQELEHSLAELKLLPTQLSEYPYEGILWDSQTETVNVGARALTRELLLYYLGYIKDPKRIKKMQARYAAVRGGDVADFPIQQHKRA